jgi:hypothetical protein
MNDAPIVPMIRHSRSICVRALGAVPALTNALRPSSSRTIHFSACV